MIDSLEPVWEPCESCQAKLEQSKKKSKLKKKEHQEFFKRFRDSGTFEMGRHGTEKALLKQIDFDLEEERLRATRGIVIDIQTGKFHGEFKFIVHNYRNGEPLHYIFLKRPEEDTPSLVNVYNPTEGMFFKWSKEGKERLFLNSFRSCCPHPLDSEENHHKEHHGKQHPLYDYQKSEKNG